MSEQSPADQDEDHFAAAAPRETLPGPGLAGDSDISGATGSAYTLADADEGKTVKVRVSFTDDGGNEETLTSAATEAVAGNEESAVAGNEEPV